MSDQSPPLAPLSGILVVELGSRIGCSVCSSLLAQLGADVIAFEATDRSHFSEKSVYRDQLMVDKLSFAPNFSIPKDRELANEIVRQGDILVLSSDVDGNHNLAIPKQTNQIVCDITAFGSSGPLVGERYSDPAIQALSGIAHTTGLEDGPPIIINLPIVEYLCGIYAATAIIAANRVRRVAGVGQAVEVALYDCAFMSTSSFLTQVLGGEHSTAIKRLGNRHPNTAPWNVYRAKDGWVLICTGSDDQWHRLCRIMGRDDLLDDPRFRKSTDRVARVRDVDRVVEAWVGEQSVFHCVSALTSAAIACGPIVTVEDFPREANLEYRSMVQQLRRSDGSSYFVPGSPLRMDRTPGKGPQYISEPGADQARIIGLMNRRRSDLRLSATDRIPEMPLLGVRIVEVGHYTTAPVAARVLGSLGAEVIKVEPPEGEASRAWPPVERNQSIFYTISNSDKKSVTLDLNTEEGQNLLRELLRDADVLIENLKPGALAKRGFGHQELHDLNPQLVYCAVSGFGAVSLYPGRPAFDTVIQAMGGLMDLIRVHSIPVKTGISVADIMGAAIAALAILAAVEWRDRGGTGQFIDLSMQDIVAWSTQLAWNGRQDLLKTPAVQVAQRGYAIEIEGNLIPILTPNEVFCAQQTSARELHISVGDRRGEWPALAVPMRLSQTPVAVRSPAPELGQDNESIIGSLRNRLEKRKDQKPPSNTRSV